jgi:hypothetical protein
MADSAARASVLTAEQRRELIGLRMIWDKWYAINFDGVHWTAIPAGTETVLSADSSDQLWIIIRHDNAARLRRLANGGHWVARQSGPDFFQPAPDDARRATTTDDAA